jgi:hypothetical protein
VGYDSGKNKKKLLEERTMSTHHEKSHRPAASSPAPKAPLPAHLPPAVKAGTQGGGAALDRRTNAEMSAKFGHDFSSIRIHTDHRAGEAADAMGANAYALGGDIVFGAGKYQPGSRETDRLLAHELTHVAQQSQFGPGDWGRTSGKGDASEREADNFASLVMKGRSVDVQAAPGAAVARDEDDTDGPAASYQPNQSQEQNYVNAPAGEEADPNQNQSYRPGYGPNMSPEPEGIPSSEDYQNWMQLPLEKGAGKAVEKGEEKIVQEALGAGASETVVGIAVNTLGMSSDRSPEGQKAFEDSEKANGYDDQYNEQHENEKLIEQEEQNTPVELPPSLGEKYITGTSVPEEGDL